MEKKRLHCTEVMVLVFREDEWDFYEKLSEPERLDVLAGMTSHRMAGRTEADGTVELNGQFGAGGNSSLLLSHGSYVVGSHVLVILRDGQQPVIKWLRDFATDTGEHGDRYQLPLEIGQHIALEKVRKQVLFQENLQFRSKLRIATFECIRRKFGNFHYNIRASFILAAAVVFDQ